MDELLALFKYDHLSGDARKLGKASADLAYLLAKLPDGGEKAAATRKLLDVRELALRVAPTSQPKAEAQV